MAELWFIRHFRTAWNAEGRLQGQRDIPLDDPFNSQNRAIIARNQRVLAGMDFAQVLTSPLERARQTAAMHGYPAAIPTPNLAELNFGQWEGRTWAELDQAHPEAWETALHTIPLGEPFDDFITRILAVYQHAQKLSGPTLVFGHGAWLGGLRMALEGRTQGGMPRHLVANGELLRFPL